MEGQTTALITALEHQQRVMGLSDEAFASKLSISRSLWIMTKMGRMPIGMSLLAGIVREFPGLNTEVLTVLRQFRRTADLTEKSA